MDPTDQVAPLTLFPSSGRCSKLDPVLGEEGFVVFMSHTHFLLLDATQSSLHRLYIAIDSCRGSAKYNLQPQEFSEVTNVQSPVTKALVSPLLQSEAKDISMRSIEEHKLGEGNFLIQVSGGMGKGYLGSE